MLTRIDVVIILASMVLVIGVGVLAGRKRSETAHGYFLGGNRMPWWLIGTAFVATGISSEQMIGTVGITYEHGMGIANWEWYRAAGLLDGVHLLHPLVPEEQGHHGAGIPGRPLRAGLRHDLFVHPPLLVRVRLHGHRALCRQPGVFRGHRLELLLSWCC